MLDFNYLKYLFRSKKYLLLVYLLISLFTSFNVSEDGAKISIFVFSLMLSYVVPLNVFFFVHDKRAVDTYFTLPISRKALLYTGLLFSILVPCFIFDAGTLLIQILNHSLTIETLLGIGLMDVCFITLVVFNTLVFLIGNNSLDGFVMLGAYSVLPLSIYVVMEVFVENFVCGFQNINFDFCIHASPIAICIAFFANNYDFSINLNTTYLLQALLLLVVCMFLLHKSFIKRNVERAGSLSSEVVAYPLVISLYTLLCLFSIIGNYSYYYNSIREYLLDYFLLFIIIFVLYVSAHFVYKRKFYFDFKMLAFYCTGIVFALVITFLARSTNGFGISNTYIQNDPNVSYELYISKFSDEDDAMTTWLEQEMNIEDCYYYSIRIEAGPKYNGKTLSNENISYFENIRKDAIHQFYTCGEYLGDSLIVKNDKENKLFQYNYDCEISLNSETLLKLASDPNIDVTMEVNDATYEIKEDLSFVLLDHYYYGY